MVIDYDSTNVIGSYRYNIDDRAHSTQDHMHEEPPIKHNGNPLVTKWFNMVTKWLYILMSNPKIIKILMSYAIIIKYAWKEASYQYVYYIQQ